MANRRGTARYPLYTGMFDRRGFLESADRTLIAVNPGAAHSLVRSRLCGPLNTEIGSGGPIRTPPRALANSVGPACCFGRLTASVVAPRLQFNHLSPARFAARQSYSVRGNS